MNSGFDLNINNYSMKELKELFDLPMNYNNAMVDIQESKLRQNILNDPNIASTIKTNTLHFIQTVKKILINEKEKEKEKEGFKNELVVESSNNIKETASMYSQGIINPLSKKILRQNINIDTRFRDNYYTTLASNFYVDLPIKLSKVVSLELTAIELPNTFYVISQVFGNNFFVLNIPNEDPFIVTIPDGNYDYLSLQLYINNTLLKNNVYKNIQVLVDANTPNGSGPQGGSGKMIVGTTSTENFSINFLTDRYGNEDRQTPLPLKLGWLMGFREGYYENNTTYVSEGIINLIGPRYVYLVVDDFNNSVLDGFYGAFSSSILNKNILARISLQGSIFNYISKDNISLVGATPRQYFGPVDIQKLQIQLLDEYGRILNLNNMDYSFCLTFQTMYE